MRKGTALRLVAPAIPTAPGPVNITPPQVSSVRSAVTAARVLFANELIFGDDVNRGVAGLHPEAGWPAKVLHSLEGVARMVQVRRQGLLKYGMIGWLNQNGFRCSGESTDARKRFDRRKARTFHDGERRVFFSPHLKVSDGVSPDRCVRIYFDWRENSQKAVVGWVGRHPK